MPVICSPFTGQKPFEISKSHTQFRKLCLADFTPNIEEINISILIGLDYYFSLINSAVATDGGWEGLFCFCFFVVFFFWGGGGQGGQGFSSFIQTNGLIDSWKIAGLEKLH